MQSVRPPTDGSLKPIRDDLDSAHRRITKETNRRKMLREDVGKMASQLEAVMDYLDGAHRIGKGGVFLSFSKTAVILSSEEEEEET